MEHSQLKTSQFIVGVALFIVGIALIAVAVLVVLFTDCPASVGAAIGIPGVGLIATSRLVLVAPSRRQQIVHLPRCGACSGVCERN
jgi:hypothetical protein